MNLGSPACEAAKALRPSEHWTTFRAALAEQMRKSMNQTLEAPPERLADAVGYTRALRDLHVALESATNGVPFNQVKKPGPEKTNG